MNGKRFSLGLVLTVLLAVVTVTILAWTLPEEFYMDGEYPYWKQQKDYILTDGTHSETLLLGDSRMKVGVRPELLGDDVFNLALGGGTPIEMYYTLTDYLAHHPTPKMIIVAFGPTHYNDIGCYMSRNAYFHYFSKERLEEVNQKILELNKKDYSSETYRYVYRFPIVYMKPLLNALKSPQTPSNHARYEKAAEILGRMPAPEKEMVNVEPEETKDTHFRPMASQTYYMQKLIEACLEHHIPLHIEQAPMGRYGIAKLAASGYLAEYEAYMKSFAEKYPLDVNPTIPAYEDDEFGDNSHLNEKGQLHFTEELRRKYFE